MSRSTTRGRWALALLGASLVWFYRRGLSPPQRAGGPPPAGAITPAGAEAAASRGASPQFAWATAATIEPWVEGRAFFPGFSPDVRAPGSPGTILSSAGREA